MKEVAVFVHWFSLTGTDQETYVRVNLEPNALMRGQLTRPPKHVEILPWLRASSLKPDVPSMNPIQL